MLRCSQIITNIYENHDARKVIHTRLEHVYNIIDNVLRMSVLAVSIHIIWHALLLVPTTLRRS